MTNSANGLSPWHTPARTSPPRRFAMRRAVRHGQGPTIEKHKATLAADAPLRTMLESQAFRDHLVGYEQMNRSAIKAQSRYRRWGLVALSLATLATLLAALTLLPISTLFPHDATRYVSGLQFAANAFSLLIVWQLNRTGAIDSWMTSRAEAERLRGMLFAELLRAPDPPGADPSKTWQEKLELLEAAHLGYQQAYFESAARRNTTSARRLSLPRRLALAAIALAGVIGAITFLDWWPRDFTNLVPWLKLVEEPIRWQLGLNTFASGLLAFASAHAMIHQNERNAVLFRRSAEQLAALRASEGKATADAARRGDGGQVLAYAQKAQAILEADHIVWQLNRPPANPLGGPPSSLRV